ncbi:hypothetical protein M892_18845 [Vibrio campbellii ATCC BAA-1116]|nr:hypothetical protein M892_18845 [Vibrio campbellii ATCC BAA-1116]
MQGAPISSRIAAKKNKPRLGNQAGFYFASHLSTTLRSAMHHAIISAISLANDVLC